MNVGHDMKNLRCLFMWEGQKNFWNGFKHHKNIFLFYFFFPPRFLSLEFPFVAKIFWIFLSLLAKNSLPLMRMKMQKSTQKWTFPLLQTETFYFDLLLLRVSSAFVGGWIEYNSSFSTMARVKMLNSKNNQSKMSMNVMKDWTINYVNLFFKLSWKHKQHENILKSLVKCNCCTQATLSLSLLFCWCY